MAEFHFYASQADRQALLRALIEHGGVRFFADRHYLEPSATLLKDANARELAIGHPLFYGVSAASEGVPAMKQIPAGEEAGKWYIDVFCSPPMIGLRLPAQYEEQGSWRFSSGTISYPAVGNARIEPAIRQDLATLARDAIGVLKAKKLLRSTSVGGSRVWLSDGAREELKKGALFIVNGKLVAFEGPSW